VPVGHGANPVVWALAIGTAVLAGVAVARLAARAAGWWARLGVALGGALCAGLVMLVLGWQAGGAVGDARLHTVGPSPWLLGAAVAGAVAVASLVAGGLGVALSAVWRLVHREQDDEAVSFDDLLPRAKRTPRLVVLTPHAESADDADSDGELAG
jgi:hypothetical protein